MFAGGSEAGRIDSSGNLAIGGSTATNRTLSMKGASNNDGFFSTFGSGFSIQVARHPLTGTFSNTSTAGAAINLMTANADSSITFWTTTVNNATPLQRMTINKNGRVGIGFGSADPLSPLSVSGVIASGNFTAVGVGGTPGDANTAEVGPGYINLARDDTANAKQILFGKNGAVHSYLETTAGALIIGGTTSVGIGASGYNANIGNDGRWRGGYRTQSQNAFIGQKPFNIYAVGERWHELHSPSSASSGHEYNIAGASYTTDHNTVFYHPSNVTSSVIRYDFAPRGGVDLVAEFVSDSNNTWNGGFNSSAFTVDPDKCYMFGYYFRRTGSSTAGTHYFGFSHGIAAGTGTTVNSNPYFFAQTWSAYARYQWHVAVCYLYPRYYNAGTSDAGAYIRTGGVWNLNGDYRHGYSRFKQPTNQTTQVMRAYNYYCADPNMTYQYASPFVYECNGAQPTLGELLIGNERIGE